MLFQNQQCYSNHHHHLTTVLEERRQQRIVSILKQKMETRHLSILIVVTRSKLPLSTTKNSFRTPDKNGNHTGKIQ